MLKISFTNAEVSDHGYGLEVNGKSLLSVNSLYFLSIYLPYYVFFYSTEISFYISLYYYINYRLPPCFS